MADFGAGEGAVLVIEVLGLYVPGVAGAGGLGAAEAVVGVVGVAVGEVVGGVGLVVYAVYVSGDEVVAVVYAFVAQGAGVAVGLALGSGANGGG